MAELKKYAVQVFGGTTHVSDVHWVEYKPDWVIFHHDDHHGKVTAYPAHIVRGPITEVSE